MEKKERKKARGLRVLGLGGCKLPSILTVFIPLNKYTLFTPVSSALWKLLTSLHWSLRFEALPLSQTGIKNLRPARLSKALLMSAIETRHKIKN